MIAQGGNLGGTCADDHMTESDRSKRQQALPSGCGVLISAPRDLEYAGHPAHAAADEQRKRREPQPQHRARRCPRITRDNFAQPEDTHASSDDTWKGAGMVVTQGI